MKKEAFAFQLQDGLSDVRVSPRLRRRTLDAMQGKEPVIMKKKLSVGAVCALLILAIAAVALAAATHAGMFDFIGRYQGTYIPEDAQSYVQTDVLSLSNEMVSVNLKELYYDGHVARLTLDVTPRDPHILLMGVDSTLEDNWQNLVRLNRDWDDADKRTVAEYAAQQGFTSAYVINAYLDEVATGEVTGGSMDYNLSEDGVLTHYAQMDFMDVQPTRNTTLHVTLSPYSAPLDKDSRRTGEAIKLETPLTLDASQHARQTDDPTAYESTEPIDFPSVGVRVDSLRIDVTAHELYVTLDYTVTDRDAYAVTDNGLWFEFIDPDSAETEPYKQRLSAGLSGGGSVAPVDSDDPDKATHFRQQETLGLNELRDTYTLRAYSAWEKDRYETRTVELRPVK